MKFIENMWNFLEHEMIWHVFNDFKIVCKVHGICMILFNDRLYKKYEKLNIYTIINVHVVAFMKVICNKSLSWSDFINL